MTENFFTAAPRRKLLFFAVCFMLAVYGCGRRTENIAGVEIPIPKNMTKNADAVIEPVIGVQDGQVSYQGKVTAKDIFTFYQEIMAADGWQPTAQFSDKPNRIAYTKGNRLVLIRYDKAENDVMILTILVGMLAPAK